MIYPLTKYNTLSISCFASAYVCPSFAKGLISQLEIIYFFFLKSFIYSQSLLKYPFSDNRIGKITRNSGSRGADVRDGRASSLFLIERAMSYFSSTKEKSGVSFVSTSRPFVCICCNPCCAEYLVVISPGRRRQNGWLSQGDQRSQLTDLCELGANTCET